MFRTPKYSRKYSQKKEETATERRQRMEEIDQRNEQAFWEKYKDKVCENCGFILDGNARITGYCGECRSAVSDARAKEKYEEKERRLKARFFEERESARRSK